MDIRAFTAMGIIQQAISNQVSILHTTTPDSAQNRAVAEAECNTVIDLKLEHDAA